MTFVDELPSEIREELRNLGVNLKDEDEVIITLAIALGLATLRKTKRGYTIMLVNPKKTPTPKRQLAMEIRRIIWSYVGRLPWEVRSAVAKELYQYFYKELYEEREKVLSEEKKRLLEEKIKDLITKIYNEQKSE
jgi:hypothetical protein